MKNLRTDYRVDAFRTKFTNASKHLGAAPDQIISLKLRDIVASYSEYQDALRLLDREVGIQSSPIQDDLQGNGHLVSQGDQRIIVVEHETGLEILFVASSIASLVGLVPLVVQAWNSIRGHFAGHQANHIRRAEIRRIDSGGNLHEDHRHDLPSSLFFPFSMLNSAILSAANALENDLKSLKEEVRSQNERLAVIERALKLPNKVTTNKRTDEKSSKVVKRIGGKRRPPPD